MARKVDIHDGPPPPKAPPEFISRHHRRRIVSQMRPGQWFRRHADEHDRVAWIQSAIAANARISTWRNGRHFIYRRDQ